VHFRAFSNGFLHKSLGLQNFVIFYLLVDIVTLQGVSVTTDYRDNLKTIGVFIRWEYLLRFFEVFTCHQEVFVVHAQNTLAKVPVVGRCVVQLLMFFYFLDVH